ncbi:MAG: FCD domain-containing protein [Clostridia bacterium]|nr:FCD domain-containing protein [Clostridia bacterium]
MASTMTNLDLLQSRTLADLVQQEILRLIKAGEITAGSKLNELTFVQLLRVSRAPIREAFRALEAAGLVKLEKNRGVFVREISGDEARELYQLRAILDETAGRYLAPRISDAEIIELQGWLIRLEAAAATGQVGDYFPLNIAFHDRIVEMTGNMTLLEFYRRAIDRMHLLRRQSFSAPGGSSPSRQEHRAIVAALESRDPDLAAAILRKHVENGYQRFLDINT